MTADGRSEQASRGRTRSGLIQIRPAGLCQATAKRWGLVRQEALCPSKNCKPIAAAKSLGNWTEEKGSYAIEISRRWFEALTILRHDLKSGLARHCAGIEAVRTNTAGSMYSNVRPASDRVYP